MKKKLPLAKTPLPRFRSDSEAADYFQTHSAADVWDRLSKTEPAKVSKALKKSIGERHTVGDRHTAAKSPISIRLGIETRGEAGIAPKG